MEPTLNIKLNINAANIILNALSERPFKEAAGLIAEIRKQADAQLAPPAPEPQQEPQE